MWSKERLKDQITKVTPNEVVIQNLSFFTSKVIISGYGHISRRGQLKTVEKQLSIKSQWNIKYDIIPVSGMFQKDYLNTIFLSIPRLEINSIEIDQKLKDISICFQKQPLNILKKLQELESSLNIKLSVNSIENSKLYSLDELNEQYEKMYKPSGVVNQKIDNTELKNKIRTLLPSWFKTTRINIFKDKAEILTNNDISDIERISFLNLLLESQIGLKIEIKQTYNTENQLEALSKFLKTYFNIFEITLLKEKEVKVEYEDFPLNEDQLQKIKAESFKKTRLEIVEIDSNFKATSEKICLQLKDWLVNNNLMLEYCFVHFNNNERRFDVFIPEPNSEENRTLDQLYSLIKNQYGFKYPFQVKWIEEDPVFYLKERIFTGTHKNNLKKIEYNRPVIKIYYQTPDMISFSIWEKILFRFIKFEVFIIDVVSNSSINLFEFGDNILKLDNDKIIQLLIKVMSTESEKLNVYSLIYSEEKDKFILTYDSYFFQKDLKEFSDKWSSILHIQIETVPLRSKDEIIYQILSSLPDWVINPKLYFNQEDNLLLIVQNDYEDKLQIEKFVQEQSDLNQIPINLEINLSVTRIKQIVYQSLADYIEISRLKIYPEKTNIYLEGIIKSNQDEELLEEEINRIETKTLYTIESYFKRRSVATNKQSVHDLLQELLNTYQIIPFTDEIYKEAELIESFDASKHGMDRIDLRDLDCFSIDPTGTKAVDDCISVQRITNGDKEDELLIGIHVVDITAFVEKDSLIDKEARRRSYSVYLNHEKQTYPLFPENLIEKVSLTEGIEKPALSLFIRVSLQASIEEFFLKKTIIMNKKQFTYTKVNEILIEQQGEFLTDLQLLVSITSQFKSSRVLRGSINLDFMPDNIADQIVSELMVMANRLVGFHLQSQPGQKVFRNQHIQSYTYLLLQKNFTALGYTLDILNKNPLTDINRIIQEATINGESELIMSELRNFLSNAYYSHTCTGHEALGTKWYTQWTSPLRKYMDVVTHRILNKEYIEDLQYLCQYSSAVERLLKIKIDSVLKNYYISLLENCIAEKKELKVRLFKQTRRNIILSTDLDFFLSIINQIEANKFDHTETLSGIFQNKELMKIRIYKAMKDKKDISVHFDFVTNNETNGSLNLIKAKIVFLEE